MDQTTGTGGSLKADHLCVLVHGLWGNPKHLSNIAKALRSRYSPDELYLLLARRNSGSFTYDGIERGGERVCAEIEEEMRLIEQRGGKIQKLSIVGYSLGGLVSRYAVGLLNARGVLDRVTCMNFATFASPHLGVRTPLKGWHNHIWNVLGARTLSMSGRQLFTIDNFRNTGKPLLSVLADPNSIFMNGLRKFRRHTLYANIVNDRSAVYYTTGISKIDPYHKMDQIKVNFVKGREGVILDPTTPFVPRAKVAEPTTLPSLARTGIRWAKRGPFLAAVALVVPLGIATYLLNSVVQNIRSSSRIKLHESGKAGLKVEEYRMPPLMTEIREEVEHAYEELNSSQNQAYLTAGDDDLRLSTKDRITMARERRMSLPGQPTLALTAHQFDMIEALDTLKWRKYPVWIQKNPHSHAAIIVRMDRKTFDEGWVVLDHFTNDEFLG
ncbi:lipase/serine esterase [Paramyrothecium foliicola]|nr:lipase/serine esterase [Paramyrothecium foliicola]